MAFCFDSNEMKTYVESNSLDIVAIINHNLFDKNNFEDVKKNINDEAWCCFALMCFKDLTLNEKIDLIRFYREKGIYLITVDDYKYLPQKLADLLEVSF